VFKTKEEKLFTFENLEEDAKFGFLVTKIKEIKVIDI